MSIKTKLETVTPEDAIKWLDEYEAAVSDGKARNRRFWPNKVAQYAHDMKGGRWEVNHQGIAFDTNGILIDGQHRLRAICKAGTPIEMLVTTGLESHYRSNGKVMSTIDAGRPRSVADLMWINSGVEHAPSIAAGVRCVFSILPVDGRKKCFSLSQIMDAFDLLSEGFRLSLMNLEDGNLRSFILGPIAFYLQVRPNEVALADQLQNLERLDKGSPVLALHKAMTMHKLSVMKIRKMARLTCHAIWAWHNSETLTQCDWTKMWEEPLFDLNPELTAKLIKIAGSK